MIVTVIVVIAIAAIAVICGVAIAAIAAIAGLVSLVLCIADVICMIATGGKSIADVCREKGLGWLGEIFDGVSIGCDIVSIVLPLGAAIKSIAKVGVKTFAKASIKAMKVAFKETCEPLGKNGFKKGFKYGMKNLGKLAFKTFVFDIDDISKLNNGKRTWNLMEETVDMIGPNKNWIKSNGELIPSADNIPKLCNPDELTMKELLSKYGVDSIPIDKTGVIDLSAISVAESPISMKNLDIDIDGVLSGEISEKNFFAQLRRFNFNNADDALPKGVTLETLENQFGFKIARHEDFNMKKVFYVPTQIHANLGHTGGVSNFKFIFNKIPDLSNLIANKFTQFTYRFGIEN